MVGLRSLLIGLGYVAGAVLLALLVILPVFWLLDLIYDDGRGLTPLLVIVVAAWAVLAWFLRRPRVSL